MAQPLISVVIPAYNEEKLLSHVLTSLKKQTFSHPYEIIVVDNNSTDRTGEIAKKYGATVILEKKQGYAQACNKGFYAAKGIIIARADADYVLPTHWLEVIWNVFQKKDQVLVAVGGPVYPLEGYGWERLFTYPASVAWIYILKLFGRGFLFPNIAMRKVDFLKTKGFNTDISFGEDMDMCKQLQSLGNVEINLHIYAYASMRRLYNMGFMKFMTEYVLANQMAMWRGKKAVYGTDVIRQMPAVPTEPHSPWIYITALPLVILCLIIILFINLAHL
jgi:glycosyltransferase involved in cell wall biosynthesis